MDDFGIRLDQLDEDRPKLGVPSGELDSQSWKDRLEAPPVLEVSGAEKGGTQPPVRKRPLRNCLCDGTLPSPSEPVQPVDGGPVEVTGPEFDFVQNRCPCSSEASIPIAMSIFGLLCAPYVIEDSGFSCSRVFFQRIVMETRGWKVL